VVLSSSRRENSHVPKPQPRRIVLTGATRGLGRALVRHAIARCTAAGEVRMGLTVTEGNPAEHLYTALGFARTRTLYVLEE